MPISHATIPPSYTGICVPRDNSSLMWTLPCALRLRSPFCQHVAANDVSIAITQPSASTRRYGPGRTCGTGRNTLLNDAAVVVNSIRKTVYALFTATYVSLTTAAPSSAVMHALLVIY